MIDKEELLEEIEKLKNEEVLCIVEGPKDRKALESFGIHNIVELSKAPLYRIVEEVAEKGKEVAILTDMDEKGKQLYHVLSRDLQRRGIKIDNKLRGKLFRAKISHVEGLDTYLS